MQPGDCCRDALFILLLFSSACCSLLLLMHTLTSRMPGPWFNLVLCALMLSTCHPQTRPSLFLRPASWCTVRFFYRSSQHLRKQYNSTMSTYLRPTLTSTTEHTQGHIDPVAPRGGSKDWKHGSIGCNAQRRDCNADRYEEKGGGAALYEQQRGNKQETGTRWLKE